MSKPTNKEEWEERFDKIGFDNQVEIISGGKRRVELKAFIRKQLLLAKQQERQDVVEEVEKALVGEMLIANKEGQPTSRLTSLSTFLSKLKEK